MNDAKPAGYPARTWNDVPTEGLNATVHGQFESDLPWARAAAAEWLRRFGGSPLRSWCSCPWCRERRAAKTSR